jgi:hypothetical protein
LRAAKDPDAYVRSVTEANPNMLVPHYLMACFLYYKEDDPLISDALFDEMSKELQAKWETITHFHKHLISLDDLRAGTGYAIQYPSRVRGAAVALVRRFRGG